MWETRITLSSGRFWPELQRIVMAGDSWWYARIAAAGYDKTLATPTIAFFPMFPFTDHVCAFVAALLVADCASHALRSNRALRVANESERA
jgi:hypothetical protein